MSKKLKALRARAQARVKKGNDPLPDLDWVEAQDVRKKNPVYDAELVSPETDGGNALFLLAIGKKKKAITTFTSKVPSKMKKGSECVITLGVRKPRGKHKTGLVFVKNIDY